MEKEVILTQCDCGMHIIKIEELDWDEGKEYAISFFVDAHQEKQGMFNHLKERIRAAAKILFHGHHRFYDIVLTEKEYENLKQKL